MDFQVLDGAIETSLVSMRGRLGESLARVHVGLAIDAKQLALDIKGVLRVTGLSFDLLRQSSELFARHGLAFGGFQEIRQLGKGWHGVTLGNGTLYRVGCGAW